MSALRRHVSLLDYHRSMLSDADRVEAYREAIARVVRPGDVVVDLGTGTGLLAALACASGARHVYAIEDTEMVEVARTLCRTNGLEGRVTLLAGDSSEVELPEPADVIVTETMGNFGLEEGILGSVIDARARWLRAGGSVVPRVLRMFAAPVELPDFYGERIAFWGTIAGVDYRAVRSHAANNIRHADLGPASFVCDPVQLARLDLGSVASADVQASVTFVAARPAIVHALGGWFEAELADGITVGNAPPSHCSNWANAVLTLEEAIVVVAGDTLEVSIRSTDNGALWRWQVHAPASPAAGRGAVRLDQSTFWGFPLPRRR